MQRVSSSSRFVSRRSIATSGWRSAALVCLACCGRAADGDGPPTSAPDGVSAGVSEATSPDLGTAPLAADDSRCPQLPLTQVEVHDQSELEALRGCTSIAGDLTIFPFAGADLTPLAQLERVGGTFTLGNRYPVALPPRAFASLEGLESLRSVGSLIVRGVEARSLGPLSGLTQLRNSGGIAPLSGYVIIEQCPALTDLGGLDNLDGLLGFVASSDAALVSIRGLRV
jgi:hypothetical protein